MSIPDEPLIGYYLNNVSSTYRQQQLTLQQLRAERNRVVEDIPETMVMEEMKKPRPTFILKRGAYDAPSQRVQPDVPASVLPFSPDLPRNRLGLAKWLLHPDNPLTARVVVNRYWQTYFGTGLQKSANNFGNQGGLPTHPELLDWLAVTFRVSAGFPRHKRKPSERSRKYVAVARADVPADGRNDPGQRLTGEWIAISKNGRTECETVPARRLVGGK